RIGDLVEPDELEVRDLREIRERPTCLPDVTREDALLGDVNDNRGEWGERIGKGIELLGRGEWNRQQQPCTASDKQGCLRMRVPTSIHALSPLDSLLDE